MHAYVREKIKSRKIIHMEISHNLRLVLEHKQKVEARVTPKVVAVRPTIAHGTGTPHRAHLFNTMAEYTALKKAGRFDPSWALIHVQQARERGL